MKQDKQQNSQEENKKNQQKKKPYSTPQILSYGDVVELTQGAGSPKSDMAPNKML